MTALGREQSLADGCYPYLLSIYRSQLTAPDSGQPE